ncbi:hypothetical protein [Microbacterium elymi]|uniref:Uncharacterized protein n=1 Tax=Microbacterium elymi TaxID=2909587 RepID=A0ABY5NLS4_9MICO|nr:hypothetical protein [Microbacterium elymi]UUT36140.1 hypothetical protein L2X98_24065 [Microbacterium elymi]
MTFVRITDVMARNSVLPSAPIFAGSWKIVTKFSNPIQWNVPMPVQSVNAKAPPTVVAT